MMFLSQKMFHAVLAEFKMNKELIHQASSYSVKRDTVFSVALIMRYLGPCQEYAATVAGIAKE